MNVQDAEKLFEAIFKDRFEESNPTYLRCLFHYARMAEEVHAPARIVEIGTNYGKSTLMMAAALEHPGSHIITIDPVFILGEVTVPDAHQPFHRYQSDFATLRERFEQAGLWECLTVIADYSHQFLKSYSGRPIDLLFIDGEHTTSAVTADLEWMKFVRPSGYAAIDDWIQAVVQAVEPWVESHPEWTFLHKNLGPEDGNMVVTLLRKSG